MCLVLVLLFSWWRARVVRLAPAVVSIEMHGSRSLLRGLPCLFGREQWKRWLTSMLKQSVEIP